MFREHNPTASDRMVPERLVPGLRAAFAAFCIAAAVGALSGCNTTEGAGKDLENLGEGIQDAAD